MILCDGSNSRLGWWRWAILIVHSESFVDLSLDFEGGVFNCWEDGFEHVIDLSFDFNKGLAFADVESLFFIFHHFNPSLPPIVKTGASDYTITGILSICTNDSDIHPITFYSCTLHGAE